MHGIERNQRQGRKLCRVCNVRRCYCMPNVARDVEIEVGTWHTRGSTKVEVGGDWLHVVRGSDVHGSPPGRKLLTKRV